jgi:hypothetical protein
MLKSLAGFASVCLGGFIPTEAKTEWKTEIST